MRVYSIVMLLASLILLASALSYTVYQFHMIGEIIKAGPEDPLEAWSEGSYIVWQYNSTFYACRNMSTLIVEEISDNDTDILQYAINETTSPGGTVYVKAPTYTGTYNAAVTLKNNVTLIIQSGAAGITVTIDTGATATLMDYHDFEFKRWTVGTLTSLGESLANPSGYSFVVRKSGSNYIAQNGTTGLPAYYGTNALTVIQNAIYALGSAGGKMFIKAGTYPLDDILVTAPWPNDGLGTLMIQGEGIDRTILKTTVGYSMINYGKSGTNVKTHQVILMDLTLDGNYEGAGGALPQASGYIPGMFNLPQPYDNASTTAPKGIFHVIQRVKIYRPTGFGIFNPRCLKVFDCVFDSAGQPDEAIHWDIIGGGAWVDAEIIGCTYMNSAGNYVDVVVTVEGETSRVIFRNNRSYNHTIGGVYALNYKSIIEGNILTNNQSGSSISYDASTHQNNRGQNIVANNILTNLTVYYDETKSDSGYENIINGKFTENSGTVEASNDDWVAHGLAGEPDLVTLTIEETDANYCLQLKATNSTHFQIYLYDLTGAAAETVDKTINWYAEYKP